MSALDTAATIADETTDFDDFQARRPPPPTPREEDELARFVVTGIERFGWTAASAEYVRGCLGIVRSKAWRAGVLAGMAER